MKKDEKCPFYTLINNKIRYKEGSTEELTRIAQCLNAKNRFCEILKCVSIIFILNIYVLEDFRRVVSK